MPFDPAKPAADVESFCQDVRPEEELAYAQREFNEDVVDVNRGLAVAYHTAEQRLRNALAEVKYGRHARPAPWEPNWDSASPHELESRF